MKVLIVDDEPFITQGLTLLIDWEEEGYEIAACLENGKEALLRNGDAADGAAERI